MKFNLVDLDRNWKQTYLLEKKFFKAYELKTDVVTKYNFLVFIFCSRIVTQGFTKKNSNSRNTVKVIPRIPVSPSFLLELVEGAYFAMFNEFYTFALAAVKDIDTRAQYELFPDVMLVTSAVINSLKNSSGTTDDDICFSMCVFLMQSTHGTIF